MQGAPLLQPAGAVLGLRGQSAREDLHWKVLLEGRRERVKVVRREWKAALKFIARVEGEVAVGEAAAA